jgi:hypothetical protein
MTVGDAAPFLSAMRAVGFMHGSGLTRCAARQKDGVRHPDHALNQWGVPMYPPFQSAVAWALSGEPNSYFEAAIPQPESQ